MKPLAFLALAALASITVPDGAFAGPRTEKVYAANGRRVAVIKNSAFGRKVYGADGRRVATVKSR